MFSACSVKREAIMKEMQESIGLLKICLKEESENFVWLFKKTDKILVFFDVVSLFISVSMDKALDLVLELRTSKESLSSRTCLKHSFSSTVFSCKISLSIRFLALLWVPASLHYCFSLHGTCQTHSYYNILHPTVSLAEMCWRHVLHSQQRSYQWLSITF